ncbi:MAG: NAD+ synthase [Pseudodesulfovibrio sp.]|uniref:Glutamine-dependent NAD(+) synthetase n=1 Tax=Pseudodesulfovibrio aespoeensis (strain ATCC 700646 / DSM 10631 / Aspo-2) TaxID=643562 RepID=E6VSC3_PSEA9|nr:MULTISPECIES: NAD+ synthase [Pseudodesulfovibrio]MBU4191908.1 NAD+ synthase [Pseudomonadota bacterium]ADU64266.1 NAD+ synthetase [Pseudodesulfovibrio aespoeensis Aspo-2]MBU4243696.1 NAD+ synthase [Pseudomonadota bacterium]MBU4378422.1 NAD+ synthase [Pseudomonadota bacterium]MBU4475664.1 NAD+ synthase [Pseudomonadota bacterium]
MKIGVLQLNPVVGDIEGNCAAIRQGVAEARSLGADLCLTPEMAVTGYPPRDLLLYGGFVARARGAADALARELEDDAPGGTPLLLGGVEPNPCNLGKPVFNAAFWCEGGAVRRVFRKTLLPTYDVFDEARYFEPAPTGDQAGNILRFKGRTIAVTICEDAWNDKDYWETRSYARDPLEEAAVHGPDLILNLSASPLFLGKQRLREDMLGAVARKYGVPLVYANQTGGNDDLIFDGRSCAFGPDGALTGRAPGFTPGVAMFDIDAPKPDAIAPDDFGREAETWRALVMGTRDYVRKSCFSTALIGLSGGIDSAVTAAVAAEALGAENVTCVLMPSPYSSRGSVDDSLALAANLGVTTLTLPIAPIMNAYALALAGPFAGLAEDTTEENIQSRIRGNLLMALSNKRGAMLLTTGNKSELAVGYCTIYGDMSGGFAVVSDMDKTGVFALARWYNAHVRPAIPEAIITKPPSAELRPDQKDQDSLPPYDVLDAILALHIERHQSARQIIGAGFDPQTVDRVLRLVRSAEFKRRQAAPGIKLTPRSFGTGWRMPLACRREI